MGFCEWIKQTEKLSREARSLLARHWNEREGCHVLSDGSLGAAGSRLWVQQTLRNRHLQVLLNQLMEQIEEQQANAKLLIQFMETIPDNGTDLERETKALAQEHLRFTEAFIFTLTRSRVQLVRVQRGTNVVLQRLRRLGRKWAASQYRRDLEAEANDLGISL